MVSTTVQAGTSPTTLAEDESNRALCESRCTEVPTWALAMQQNAVAEVCMIQEGQMHLPMLSRASTEHKLQVPCRPDYHAPPQRPWTVSYL